MLDIVDIGAVFLDHSYCKKPVFNIKSTTTQTMADNSLNWEGIGVEFHPPSPHNEVPLSALSPPHSIDSGFDNEMNFLAELDVTDLDSVLMDSIFNSDMNANQKSENSKRPAPSAQVSKKSKATEEVEDFGRNRKNAIAARENRLKKKKYVEGIEKELDQLKKENEVLKDKDRRHNQVVEKLQNEVSYLKNVIANQSTLSVLVQRLVTTPGINFTSSFASNDKDETTTSEEKKDTDDEQINSTESSSQIQSCKEKVRNLVQTRYKTRGMKRSASAAESPVGVKKARNAEVKGGVCLHVGQDKVSLEFCSQCSIKASGNAQH